MSHAGVRFGLYDDPALAAGIHERVGIEFILVFLKEHAGAHPERRDEAGESFLANAQANAQGGSYRVPLEVQRQEDAVAALLGLLGGHPHVIAMVRHRLDFLLSHREAVDIVVQRGLEQPMHDDVGITTNRTREVSVVRYIQREVLPIHLVDLPGGHVLRRPHGVRKRLGHALHHELVVAIAAYPRQGFLNRPRARNVDVEAEGLPRDVDHLLHPRLERGGGGGAAAPVRGRG